MTPYLWYITKAHLKDVEPDVHGPRDGDRSQLMLARSLARLTQEADLRTVVDAIPTVRRFRMYDDDGEPYYDGLFLRSPTSTEGCEDDFAPLEDFGMPNAGCTRIDYWNALAQEWITL